MDTVLQNLLGNALRYAKSKIRVELKQTEQEYFLAIEDDGIGIPLQERERVFDSFVRLYDAAGSDHNSQGGFGLGLAIVRRILQWHEGTAAFDEPQLLGGARIQLRWPKALG